MRKIAIYGKGGIGKSTTTSNLSAAFSVLGLRVMQIGCDPKADSTKTLMRGKLIPTVLDCIRQKKDEVTLDKIVFQGFNDVLCVETGGPTPGTGCAGRGIITAFEMLAQLKAFEIYKPDIVIYDVLGDVVCGGFAMPLRGGYAQDVYVVTSGEMMSLYAAANIASAVNLFKSKGYARLRGLILNAKGVEKEKDLVKQAAAEISTEVVQYIPRDPSIQKAENKGKTVVEAFPASALANDYLALARTVLEHGEQRQVS